MIGKRVTVSENGPNGGSECNDDGVSSGAVMSFVHKLVWVGSGICGVPGMCFDFSKCCLYETYAVSADLVVDTDCTVKLVDRFFVILLIVSNLASEMRFLLFVSIVLRLSSVFLDILSITVTPGVSRDLPVMYSSVDVVSFLFLDVISISAVLDVSRESTVV